MRILITGANGFIGSNVVKTLLKNDCDILALIPEEEFCHRILPVMDKVTIVRGELDLSPINKKTIASWKPDACINLAWNTGKDYLYSDINSDLMRSSLSFFRNLVDIGIKRIVFTGTCAEYAETLEELKEDSPVNPVTPYAKAKLELLHKVLDSNEVRNIEFSWARLFFPFGPGEAENRITPAVILSLLKNHEFPTTPGDQIRDYLYVEDISNAFHAILKNHVQGVINISSGIPVSLKQYLGIIAEKMKKTDFLKIGQIPYRNWDPPYIVGDNSKLKNLAGWKQEHTLEDGLIKTIAYWTEYFENNPGK